MFACRFRSVAEPKVDPADLSPDAHDEEDDAVMEAGVMLNSGEKSGQNLLDEEPSGNTITISDSSEGEATPQPSQVARYLSTFLKYVPVVQIRFVIFVYSGRNLSLIPLRKRQIAFLSLIKKTDPSCKNSTEDNVTSRNLYSQTLLSRVFFVSGKIYP